MTPATWHDRPAAEAVASLQSSVDAGLSTEEATARLRTHGPNVVQRRRPRSLLMVFVHQFRSLIVLLLVVASTIAFVMQDITEGIAILVVIVLNALIGFGTEWKASRALDALRSEEAPRARVVRDGTELALPASALVPGDVLLLNAGDRVPADARLLQDAGLRVDESSLTGESNAVTKATDDAIDAVATLGDRVTMVFTGTTVLAGRGRAIVTATGIETELGHIGALLDDAADRVTPLETKLAGLNRAMLVLVLVLCAIIVLAGWLRGNDLLRMVEVGVSLAIAAVPEGLLAVTTMTLAIGMQRMARMKALVRRLPAVEALGSTTVICTDKTGTLTRNAMTVSVLLAADQRVDVGTGAAPSGVDISAGDPVTVAIRIGALCNDATFAPDAASAALGDPTEVALLALAERAGLHPDAMREAYPRLAEVPFDSESKQMLTLHRTPAGASVLYAKGAPSALLALSGWVLDASGRTAITDDARHGWIARNDELAGAALRVLALAYRDLDAPESAITPALARELTFVGLVGMIDPLSDGVVETVRTCRDAGIRVVMITGDQQATAAEIARQLGIDVGANGEPLQVVHARALATLDDAGWDAIVRDAAVFARVTPEHKLRIVAALERQGEIVAMTGDGVNDAPALKTADIGIAMGIRGTDVAKDAADIVITDDHFSTIVGAVEQGRVIVSNILRFIHYLFACNFAELLTVFASIMLAWPLPVGVLQILWLNMITDLFPAMSLALEPAASGVMQRAPRDPAEPLLTAHFMWRIVWQGVLLAGCTLFAFRVGLRWYGDTGDGLRHAVTMAFMTLAMVQIAHTFNARSETRSIFSAGLFSNRWLWAAVVGSAAVQLCAVEIPLLREVLGTVSLSLRDWGVVIGCSLLPIPVIEAVKAVARARLDPAVPSNRAPTVR